MESTGPEPGHPLDVIAAEPPSFPVSTVLRLAREEYGLVAQAASLVSERDQNFRLTAADGRRYVLKVANAAEDPQVVDFQIRALLHLEGKGDPMLDVPKVLRTLDGETRTTLAAGGRTHAVRIVTWLEGRPLGATLPDARLSESMGRFLARLGLALADFTHEAADHSLLWDMQRATELRDLVRHIRTPALADLVRRTLDEFETNALPAFADLRRQVIHNDMNPDNVLVRGDRDLEMAGMIDFGDMLLAPLIVDVAVAAAYLRDPGERPLALIERFVAGYDAERPLEEAELGVLHTLIKTRLATTVTILEWRAAARGEDDPYLRFAVNTEATAGDFLGRLAGIPSDRAAAAWRRACGR